MERNEFALAGALLFLICATLVIALVASDAAGKGPSDWAAWVQGIGSIVAIIAAVLIGRWQVNRDDAARRADQEERWRIAEMEIAAHLRVWMRDCVKIVADNDAHATSGGQMGREYYGVPCFGFAERLDRVSAMRPALAIAVFGLVQRADRLRGDISAEWEVGGNDDAYHRLMLDMPTVFFRARAVYRAIAIQIGIPPKPSQRWEVSTMRDARNRQRKVAAALAADHSIPELD